MWVRDGDGRDWTDTSSSTGMNIEVSSVHVCSLHGVCVCVCVCVCVFAPQQENEKEEMAAENKMCRNHSPTNWCPGVYRHICIR